MINFYNNNTTFRKARTTASLPEGGGADAPEGVGKQAKAVFLQAILLMWLYSKAV